MAFLPHLLVRHVCLVILVALPHRHLGRKVAGSDGVDADLGLLELGRHELRQMHRRPLGGVVGEVALGLPHDARHAGDDNHRRREMAVTGCLGRGLEERQEGDGGEVHGRHVRVEDAVPALEILVLP